MADGLLLALGGKPKTEAEAAPAEEAVDGLDMAAGEMLAAFEAKDAAALRSALESFISMAGSAPAEE